MRSLHRLVLAFALLVCLPLLAACGGSGGGGGGGSDDPNPAAAIPADVPLYIEGTITPDGQQSERIEQLAAKFGVQDPGQRIVDLLESEGSGDVSYEKDVKPWLGKRVGLAVLSFEDDPPIVGAIGLKDPEKAEQFVKDQAKRDGDETGTYGDTTYVIDDDTWAGVAGDYLVLSDVPAQFKRVVDQIADGKGALSESDAYDDAVEDLPDGRVGTLYAPIQPLIKGLRATGDIESDPQTDQILTQVYGGLESFAGALTPAENRVVFESRLKTDGESDDLFTLLGGAKAPGLVREAPADSLAVYGLPDVGPTYKKVLSRFAGALGGAALQGQLQSQLGIDLDKDVFSWIGDTVLFVRGSGLESLDGAVMIDALDQDAAAQAIPKLIGLATQAGGIRFQPADLNGADQAFEARLPANAGVAGSVYVARAGKRVVIGLGEEATQMGLRPSASLDASGGFDRAKQALDGLDPSVLLDAQKVVALIEQAASGDPDFQAAKPYLEPLALLAVGNEVDDDTYVSRVAVTVE